MMPEWTNKAANPDPNRSNGRRLRAVIFAVETSAAYGSVAKRLMLPQDEG